MSHFILGLFIIFLIGIIIVNLFIDIQEYRNKIQNDLNCDELLEKIESGETIGARTDIIIINTWISKECFNA